VVAILFFDLECGSKASAFLSSFILFPMFIAKAAALLPHSKVKDYFLPS
jgi:hypothetical protein